MNIKLYGKAKKKFKNICYNQEKEDIMQVKTYHTGPLGVNTYVLTDENSKEAIIFDVGGNFKEIKDDTEKRGYKILYVLNTHGHFDHIAGEPEIRTDFPDIPVYVGENDSFHCKHFGEIMNQWGFMSDTETFNPTKFIDENFDLKIGNAKIQILKTPGHSKGGLCYFVDEKLFSGDTLFAESIGRADFIDGDFDTLIASIKTKLLPLPENTIVYPGHGPATTIKHEKENNPYLK